MSVHHEVADAAFKALLDGTQPFESRTASFMLGKTANVILFAQLEQGIAAVGEGCAVHCFIDNQLNEMREK